MINNSRTKMMVSAAAAFDSNWRVNDTKILVFAGLVCEMNGLKPKDFFRRRLRFLTLKTCQFQLNTKGF